MNSVKFAAIARELRLVSERLAGGSGNDGSGLERDDSAYAILTCAAAFIETLDSSILCTICSAIEYGAGSARRDGDDNFAAGLWARIVMAGDAAAAIEFSRATPKQ